jgi:hypothetical protein
LEPLLKRLLIIFIRCVFNDYCVVSFTDFVAFLGLALPLIWDLDKPRRRRRFGDKLHYVILQEARLVSTTTTT